MKHFSLPRRVNFVAFLICVGLIIEGGYLQFVEGLEPCVLCVLQRLVFFILALQFFIGALHNATRIGARIQGTAIFLVSSLGIALAGRQVWLENQPIGKVPTCGLDLTALWHLLPFREIFKIVLNGSPDCAKVTWRFLSYSIPQWAITFFCLFAVLGIWQIFYKRNTFIHGRNT